jgi:antitoxin ParD1/3/4
MPTRKVVLTDRHQDMIERLLETGRYQDADAVLTEGLRLVEQREEAEAARLKLLVDAARVGFTDLEDGLFATVPTDALEDYVSRLGARAVDQARQVGLKGND